MRIIAVGRLRAFWTRPGCGDAGQPLRTWVHVVRAAEWANPADAKRMFRSADILPGGRVIFDIGGNRYRLVTAVRYRGRRVYIRFIGTHAEYDRVDARTV